MKTYIKLIACILWATSMLAGCDKPVVEPEIEVVPSYLRLSHNALSFDVDGTQTYVVTIESAPAEWDVETETDWIDISERTETSITIAASANDTFGERTGRIVVSNEYKTEEIVLGQLAGHSSENIPKFRLLDEFIEFQISQNGKTGLGMKTVTDPNDSKKTINNFVKIDLATSMRTEISGVANYIKGIVSDDGDVIIINNSSYAGLAKRYINGNWEDVTPVAGGTTSWVEAMSADGAIWVGYCMQRSTYLPTKWVNGIPQPLDVPKVNGMGSATSKGAMVRGCSADGSVVVGAITDNKEAIYWKSDGTWAFIAEDLLKVEEIMVYNPILDREVKQKKLCGAILEPRSNQLSANGKYVAVDYARLGDDGKTMVYIPAFVNIDTGEYTILEDITVRGFGFSASNEGLCFYALETTGQGASEGFVYDPVGETEISTVEWVKSYFGIQVTGDYYIRKVSDDGNTVTGDKVTLNLIGRPVYQPFYITREQN